MKGTDSCFPVNTCDILFVHTTASHDLHTPSRQRVKPPEQSNALFRSSLLSGSEYSAEPQRTNLFQGLSRITATVESTVESGAHPLCVRHQERIGGPVDVAFSRQAAEDDTIHAQLTAKVDVRCHSPQLLIRIEKIASTVPNDDVQPCLRQHFSCHLYLAVRGGGAALGDAHAEFHTVCPTPLCRQTAFHTVGTDFYLKITSLHVYRCLGKWSSHSLLLVFTSCSPSPMV